MSVVRRDPAPAASRRNLELTGRQNSGTSFLTMRLAGGSDPVQLRFSVLIGLDPNCSGDKTFFELAGKWTLPAAKLEKPGRPP
jgi:hypothetical protein